MAANEVERPRDLLAGLGLETRDLSSAGAEVQDSELSLEDGEFFKLLVFGVQRRTIKGGPSDKPMETWLGMSQGKAGALMPRSIRGRAQLGDQIRAQVIDNGLAYVSLATGELSRLPGHEGAWTLCDAKTGDRACLLVLTRYDRSKGRLAGAGKRFAYVTKSGGVALDRAAKTYPELAALDMPALLALAADEPDVESQIEAAPVSAPNTAADTVAVPAAQPARKRR